MFRYFNNEYNQFHITVYNTISMLHLYILLLLHVIMLFKQEQSMYAIAMDILLIIHIVIWVSF